MGIRKLPDVLINQIAAGEVIERPAFVVKELVENAIDARAKEIEVIIRNGGRSVVIVSDDGEGISKNDLKLSVQRHATSKLNESDLYNISFLGFRGEALPSIASVSDLKIESLEKNKSEAWSLQINNNEFIDFSPSSRNQGTKVSVNDLFKIVPARLKFLKSNQGENAHSQQILKRLAIANHTIKFRLKIDDKEVLNLQKEDNTKQGLRNRVLSILGISFIENSIEFNKQIFYEDNPIIIKGIISLPIFNKANQIRQYIFVNGRPVQDRGLSSVIRLSYRDGLPRGRHPLYCIFLELPNYFVDVNVHPTKMEVRFKDYALIKSLIISSITNSLNNEGNKSINLDSKNSTNSFNGLYKNNNIQSNHQSFISNLELEPFVKKYTTEVDEFNYKEIKNEMDYPLGYAIYQFKKNYILSISSNGMVIVDQHAAHERLVLEKMKKNLDSEKKETQLLLIPIVIDLENEQFNFCIQSIKIFKNLGFKIEEFGKNSIIIRAIPTLLNNLNIEEIIKDLCDDMIVTGFPVDYQEKINLIMGNICCHKAVRSGRNLTLQEMNSLLREMEVTPNSSQCNHGRPTSIQLSLKEIEKLFQRT